jgi:uncharacterized repeat protein (TIGR01451 family)
VTRRLKELRGRDRRRLLILGTCLAAIAFAIVLVASSSASLPGSTFEGDDGNLVANAAGATDWGNQTGVHKGIDEPSGSTDNAFGQGTKEDDPAVTVVDGSIPPSKNDLTRFYQAADFLGAGNNFLYLSWQRTNTNGDANLDFELNQQATVGFDGSTTGPVSLIRTEGDVLVTYDFGGSGTPTIGVLHWLMDPAKDNGSQCFSAHALPCWGNHDDVIPPATEAKVNDVTVTDPLNTNASLVAGQFGEASINLDLSKILTPDTCEAFGQVWVKSRSSASFSAEVKDFIAPAPTHVSNCAQLKVVKNAVGGDGTFPFSSTGGSIGNFSLATAAGTANQTFTNLKPGDYSITENAPPAGWDFTSASCTDDSTHGTVGSGTTTQSLTLAANQAVTCTYTNTHQGSIELKKHWSGTPGNALLKIGTSDGGTQTDTQQVTGADGTTGANVVPAGTYFLSEAFNNGTDAGDYTTALACTDNGGNVTVTNSVPVADGHTVVCTFTNTRKQGTIRLKKSWVGTAGNATLKIGTASGGSQVNSTAANGQNADSGAQTVNTGTYFVSEDVTSAADYNSALACSDNGQAATIGANNSLSVGDGHTVVCTFTNTRKQGTIELKKHWIGTPSSATLTIGSSAGGSQVASTQLSIDGTTGTKNVDTGTYFVGETVTNATEFVSTLVCTDNGNTVVPGANTSLPVADGHAVVCTYTNSHKGSIELKKHWVGSAGSATLNIGTAAGGSQVATTTLTTDGTTGAQTVGAGTYFVSENVANAGDYTSALECTDNGQTVSPGANNSLNVADAHTVVCQFTNTRKQGTIELKKHWVGTPSSATLNIGSSAGGSQVATTTVSADGTTTAKTVDTGTYFVSESVTDASDYTSTLACTDNGQTVSPGADSSLSVTNGHAVVCTYTNSHKGSIELKKHWVGTKGSATLNIGTAAGGSQVATTTLSVDGTTGAKLVVAGTYFVSEDVTNAGDYTSTLECTDNGQAVSTANNSLSVADTHTVVCQFTNTRNQGTIELKKHWVGTPSNATLSIGTAAGGDQVNSTPANGVDATSGAQTVDTGTYFVSESVTNASDYTSPLTCTDNGQAATIGADNSLSVAKGHAVVCQFTNTRKTGTIELKKHWVGTSSSATLNIGSSAGGSQVATTTVSADGTTTAKTVDTGTYFVSESVTNPDNYLSTLACTDNGDPVDPGANSSLAVADGHAVVCTYTNARVQGSVELKKHWVGTAGNVTLNIGTSADGSQVNSTQLSGTDGSTTAHGVDTGMFFVSEVFGNNTNAADYSPILACFNDRNNDGSQNNEESDVTPNETGGFAVGSGDHVICTFTNRELPKVKLVKSLVPSSDAGTFDFAIDQQAFNNGGDGFGDQGTTGFVHIQPGAPVISESGHGDTQLSNYTTAISCSNEEDGNTGATSLDLSSLTYGDSVTCTFHNSRKPTITIVKNTIGGDGTFHFTGLGGEGGFSIATNGNAGSQSFTVVPGAYHVTEDISVLVGWHLGSASCGTGGTVDGNTANITVAAGDNVRCTFVNVKNATLIVKKVVDNSNGGGTKSPADFRLHVTQGGIDVSGSPAQGSSSGTTYSLPPATYKVGEDAVSGYSLTGISGCQSDGTITLAAGTTVTCTLTNTSAAPPPPVIPPVVPPKPTIDLAISKVGSPSPTTVGGNITWTLTVVNNGPSDATGVTVADPIPAGTTYVSSASTQGTCTGGVAISCAIGAMKLGATVTITLVTTANATGTVPNTATVVGNEAETNTANNSASASVQVIGKFTPPPVYCTALAVTPKQLFVGKRNVLRIVVSQHGKRIAGIKVRIKGSTLSVTTTASNRQGVVQRTVKPTKAGIVTFVPVANKRCNAPRVGVIGVFTPPVTG